MSAPIPRTKREWWMLGVVLVAGLLIGFVSPGKGDEGTVTDLLLNMALIKIEVLENDLEVAEMWRDEYKGRLNAAEKAYSEDLDAHYDICESRHDRLWKTKAGEACWAKVEKLITQLEEEKKFYHWSLKHCGAITDKTPGQISNYESKLPEMTENEEEKMED